jgi:hypothetical protein
MCPSASHMLKILNRNGLHLKLTINLINFLILLFLDAATVFIRVVHFVVNLVARLCACVYQHRPRILDVLRRARLLRSTNCDWWFLANWSWLVKDTFANVAKHIIYTGVLSHLSATIIWIIPIFTKLVLSIHLGLNMWEGLWILWLSLDWSLNHILLLSRHVDLRLLYRIITNWLHWLLNDYGIWRKSGRHLLLWHHWKYLLIFNLFSLCIVLNKSLGLHYHLILWNLLILGLKFILRRSRMHDHLLRHLLNMLLLLHWRL